jgi:hypothetical protein
MSLKLLANRIVDSKIYLSETKAFCSIATLLLTVKDVKIPNLEEIIQGMLEKYTNLIEPRSFKIIKNLLLHSKVSYNNCLQGKTLELFNSLLRLDFNGSKALIDDKEIDFKILNKYAKVIITNIITDPLVLPWYEKPTQENLLNTLNLLGLLKEHKKFYSHLGHFDFLRLIEFVSSIPFQSRKDKKNYILSLKDIFLNSGFQGVTQLPEEVRIAFENIPEEAPVAAPGPQRLTMFQITCNIAAGLVNAGYWAGSKIVTREL